MAVVEVQCRYCEGIEVNKAGVRPSGVKRYRCLSCKRSFQLEYRYHGNQPGVADKIVDMALNGSGIRAGY